MSVSGKYYTTIYYILYTIVYTMCCIPGIVLHFEGRGTPTRKAYCGLTVERNRFCASPMWKTPVLKSRHGQDLSCDIFRPGL